MNIVSGGKRAYGIATVKASKTLPGNVEVTINAGEIAIVSMHKFKMLMTSLSLIVWKF